MQAETIVVNSLSGNVAANVVVVSSPGGVQVSGNITATSKISALRYTGNGASLTGIGASGAASTVFTTNLAANVVVQTDAAGKLANSSVTVTELAALSGTTSAIQTQLDGKLALVTSNVNVGSVAVSGDIVCAGLTSPGTVAAANYILANATNVSGIVGPLAIANVQVCDNSGIAQTDLALDSASGGYVLLNGSGFSNVSTGMLVLANANSTGFGMTVANSTTYISPSTYLCQVPALANGSYTAWMYSGTGGIATLRNALRFSTAPSWTTAATLANITKNAVFSTTLAATSDSAITYSNTTNLPGGVTLNANTGVLSGNIISNTGNTETFGFTVLAMDFELQKALRTFGLTAVGVVPIPTGTGFAALTDGTNVIIMFNTSGSITFTGSVTASILVVAGGASGAQGNTSGGGGAGGLITQSSVVIAAGTYTITVGAGGAGPVYRPTPPANPGSNTVFSTYTAIGGGGGTNASGVAGSAGRSGGGGAGSYAGVGWAIGAGGAATSGQGFAGGQGQYSGGGGGGASAVGGTGSTSNIELGADGGAGLLFDDRYYAGGGGGGVGNNGYQSKYSMGGLGGGGGGGSVARNGFDAEANSGGGGGGGNSNGGVGQAAGAGGSGIVLLKYPLTTMTPSISWIDILLIAGGGGGGSNIGGGGGAGGLVYRRVPVVTGTAYTVTIGSGGSGGAAGGSNMGTNGSNSVFGSYTALGGGAGAGSFLTGSYGGSGGGAGYGNVYYAGAGKASQGRRGGSNPTQGNGGGGGGAGGEGAAGTTSTGGAGSNSTPSAALYTAVFGAGIGVSGYFAGGGGGGYTPGSGGAGGGGAGNGFSGVANTGGGGGGGTNGNGGGGGGGSGICFVRYLSSYAAAASTTGSPSVSTVAVAGYRVYKFTGSGSITF
jgi:hypothetical protein